MRKILLSLVVLCVLPASLRAERPLPKQELEFFEQHVRPLLANKCIKCHGRDKQEGNLRLDTSAAALAGGDSGVAIVPGDPDSSLLIEALRYESLEMPPEGPLSGAEVDVMRRWVEMGAPWPEHGPLEREFSADAKDFWSFQPVGHPKVPVLDDSGWSQNAIDRFIYRKLASEGLKPARPAARGALVRRVYYDLLGLPPTPDQVDAFVADPSPLAYENLIDRLLSSPQYGEKWARHWLDLVRYAESHGHGGDQYRPNAYRYRDYVIGSLNADKPYDQFVVEQLAGDEAAPGQADALIATGLLRHWIYESNQRKVRLTREIILNDVTEVTGEVFLAMGMGCARCHDHKFDPISRRDYYRLQAFFAPMVARDDLPLLSSSDLAKRAPVQLEWEQMTADLRSQIAELEAPIRKKAVDRALRMMPQEIKDVYRKPRSENTPLELQWIALVEWQMRDDQKNPSRKMKGQTRDEWDSLNAELAKFDQHRPTDVPLAMAVTDIGPVAPPTVVPGDSTATGLEPGFLSVFGAQPVRIEPPSSQSTGRRLALARWIASPENSLTTRVIVNRVWQHHFGRGLVRTASDFGRLGELPSHPELLDWLARQFVRDGWQLKRLHRLILTSAAYRQSALRETPAIAARKDPDNRWLWRMPIRRLEAEQIRDTMLAISGELDLRQAGPSVDEDEPRRTVYTKVIRNTPNPLLRAFDGPDGFESTAQRDVTTTATQALMTLNGEWTLKRADAWAKRLQDEADEDAQRVEWAFRLALGRDVSAAQVAGGVAFIEQQSRRVRTTRPATSREEASRIALADLCHVILNSNEFLYID